MMVTINPITEVATQPLFLAKEVVMKKVACLLYPNYSLYEITTLTSTLVLHYGVKIDYIASKNQVVVSEDGLDTLPTKLIDDVNLDDYSCIILPGMIDFKEALYDDRLITFLKTLKNSSLLIAAISSAPLLLAKAGLLEDVCYTGGIWQNFFNYFDFLKIDNFKAHPVTKDKNIVTAIGFAHQEFARVVLEELHLVSDASGFFREKDSYQKSDIVFTLSEIEFAEFKEDFEKNV